MFVSILLGLGIAYGAYEFIFAKSDEDKAKNVKSEIDKNVKTEKPTELPDDHNLEPQLPVLPDISKINLPELPLGMDNKDKELPPVQNVSKTLYDAGFNALIPITPDDTKAQRLKSNIALLNGGKTPEADYDGTLAGPNAIPLTSNRVTATRIGDLKTIVAQGKMIDAILETAVNSDLPGMVRGMVSKDVFSEAGVNVLIPKGTRLIGEYKSGVALGQQRIEINWTRLIRPDGIDINLESSSTDPLGSSGIQGIVDNKYLTMFSNSILSSIVNIGIARWTDIRDKANGTTSATSTQEVIMQSLTDKNGNIIGTIPLLDSNGKVQYYTKPVGEVKTPTAADAAIKTAGQDAGKFANDIVKKQIEAVKPTIVLHQGARVRVFVSKDLVFPNIGTAGVKIIR